MEIQALENYQLYLSGSYGAKIASTFKYLRTVNKTGIFKNKKVLETDEGKIFITDDNMLDFSGYFGQDYQVGYMKKINEYIKQTILKVEDESIRERIIEIANFDLSRNSSYHIFNIEILVTCALKKPDYFYYIHTLLKEKYLYDKEKANFEFLIFSIYDAKTLEDVKSLYDTIMENSYNTYSLYERSRMYDLKEVAKNINGEEVKLLIEENMKKIAI